MLNDLRELLDWIEAIGRDEDGDAMLDADGLTQLQGLAKRVDEQHFGKEGR
jgi:hypothetical protein